MNSISLREKGCSHRRHGIHYEKGAKKSKQCFIFLLFIFIIAIGVVFYATTYKQDNISLANDVLQQDNSVENQQIVENVEDIENTENVENIETLPESLQGYTIVGKLKIEKINVEKYILGKTTNKSLNVSITKLWGGKINTPGNFSIIGHNRADQFGDLKKLEIGDTFSLIGRDGKKVTYQIYHIETIDPNNVTCLDSKEDGTKEATLITCTPGGLKRLVLKGKEI